MKAKDHIFQPKFKDIEEGNPRPSHPDFMTGTELRGVGFSGLRHNSLTDDYEIWLSGKIEHIITKAQRDLNPNAIEQHWAEIFGLDNVITRES